MKRLLNKFSSAKGFTLIELLIVVAIISALAIAVFVALNPAQRLKDANDARRAADADTILTAVHAYIVDNDGALPTGLTTTEKQVGSGDAIVCAASLTNGGCSTAASTACFDAATVLSSYIKSNPVDPLGGATYTTAKTGYSIVVDANNIVTVRACAAQGGSNISVSR